MTDLSQMLLTPDNNNRRTPSAGNAQEEPSQRFVNEIADLTESPRRSSRLTPTSNPRSYGPPRETNAPSGGGLLGGARNQQDLISPEVIGTTRSGDPGRRAGRPWIWEQTPSIYDEEEECKTDEVRRRAGRPHEQLGVALSSQYQSAEKVKLSKEDSQLMET
ncbi:MAG: hypothetical protein AAGM67_13110, partial [Bacteroidota bacterium]